MLQTVILAFAIMLLVVAGMAVGVIFRGRRLKGSCGGLSAIDGVDRCTICGRDMEAIEQDGCDR